MNRIKCTWTKFWGETFTVKQIKRDMMTNIINEPRDDKTNKMTVRPAKTKISLGICPVWSESLLSTGRKLGSLATHWAHSEDSDQTGRMPQAEPSLRWAHMPFCWFCHDVAQMHRTFNTGYKRKLSFCCWSCQHSVIDRDNKIGMF